jgi:DNA-directed RNA polymerase subunit N (RpoN/RPB10)
MMEWPREVSQWNIDLDKFTYLKESKKISSALDDLGLSRFYKITSFRMNIESILSVKDLLSKKDK